MWRSFTAEMFDKKLLWLSITPLGIPVVPEVYRIEAIASGGGDGNATSSVLWSISQRV
jgi:hypothetical protein